MEIRNIREMTGFAGTYPAWTAEENEGANRGPALDRVERSRRWVEQMEDQRVQLLALLNDGGRGHEESGGILGYMETEESKLDALSEQMKIQHKCLIISMRIMQGKKVPPEDERYLMEHDPNGYKLAMALRRPPKKDEKECESVLDDEDRQSGKTSGGGEAVPAEASGESGEAAVSGGEEAAD